MTTRPKHRGGKRLEYRLSACVSARVRVFGCDTPGISEDLSANGIRIALVSPCRFDPGERYPLEIELPGERTPIRAFGRVSRLGEPGHSPGKTSVAFEFTDINEADETRIARFIYKRQIHNRQMGLD